METKKAKTKVVAAVLALAALCVFSLFAVGGNLEPNAPPGPTMHTLDEIYNEVTSAGSEDGDSIPHHSEVEGSGAIHISLEGQTQGVIEGSCTAAGKEGTSVVLEYEHDVHIPLDTTGQPTGVRVHQPLRIVKLIDKATPLLYKALVTGERLTEVMLKWYRIGPNSEEHYFTTRLEDAIIVAIIPSGRPLEHMEDVSFTYRKIIWTWEPGGITAQDDWPTHLP